MRGNITNTGYLDDSPDRFNDYNVIPSRRITMQGVSQPLMLFPIKNGKVANPVQAMPGQDYYFPDSQGVVEIPLPQGSMQYERYRNGGPTDAQLRSLLSNVVMKKGGGTITPELAAKMLKNGMIYGKPITASQKDKLKSLAAQIGIDENGDPIEEKKDRSEDVEEYKRGGSPKAKKKHSRYTSKNIFTSINEIFARNTDLYGEGGKQFYKPELRMGGWLDQYQTRGEVQDIDYNSWKKKYRLKESPDYNLKRAWELGYTPDQKGHLPTVDEETGIFLKTRNHPTLKKELDWYNSPEGADFKSRNSIDSSGLYYKYVPKEPILKYGGWLDELPKAQPGLNNMLTMSQDLNRKKGAPTLLDIANQQRQMLQGRQQEIDRSGTLSEQIPTSVRNKIMQAERMNPSDKSAYEKQKEETVKAMHPAKVLERKIDAKIKEQGLKDPRLIEQEKERLKYVYDPGFTDYLGQAGYMPLLAISDPFSMGERLEQLRDITTDPTLSYGQRFNKAMQDVQAPAAWEGIANAFTEGAMEGIVPAISKFTKSPLMQENLFSPLPKSTVSNASLDKPLLNMSKEPLIETGISEPKQSLALWQMEEVPGLHIRSTIKGSPLEKNLSKLGEINTKSIQAFINKSDTPAADKFYLQKVLDEKFAGQSKINYDSFRKAVSEELIPLEKNVIPNYEHSNYGLERIGYADDLPLENETFTFSNKEKFGRGDTKHFTDPATLGHTRTLVSKEEPDIMHILESQSDFYQGSGKTPLEKLKSQPVNHEFMLSKRTQQLENFAKGLDEDEKILADYEQRFAKNLPDSQGHTIHENQIRQMRDMYNGKKQKFLLDKAELQNWEQKAHLGKGHQERFLQENLKHAAEKGMKKMRYPTSETAAKIQGYGKEIVDPEILAQKTSLVQKQEEYLQKFMKASDAAEREKILEQFKLYDNKVKELEKAAPNVYSKEHQTILKKYADQPKMFKKVLGSEPKLITDSKGNTWYEFDIPDSFKQGKAEIRAFKKGGQSNWLDEYE